MMTLVVRRAALSFAIELFSLLAGSAERWGLERRGTWQSATRGERSGPGAEQFRTEVRLIFVAVTWPDLSGAEPPVNLFPAASAG